MFTLYFRTHTYTLLLIMLIIEECLTLFYNSNIVLFYIFFRIMSYLFASINTSIKTVSQQYIGLIAQVQFLNFQYINSLKLCISIRYVLDYYQSISYKLLTNIHRFIIEKFSLYLKKVRYNIVNLINKVT